MSLWNSHAKQNIPSVLILADVLKDFYFQKRIRIFIFDAKIHTFLVQRYLAVAIHT